MPKPPPLSDLQKKRLGKLEPALRRAATRGDYEAASELASEIQGVLRPTGHETRLMQAKNWLFQAALEAGRLQIASTGLEGIRRKTNKRTRVHLEATVLLALCHLRRGDMKSAEPLIRQALRADRNISSDRRRAQFTRRMIDRFEQEWILAVLRDDGLGPLDPVQIQEEAGNLVQSRTEAEIEFRLGALVPKDLVERMFEVYEFSRRQLPPGDLKFLPSPSDRRDRKEVGKTLLSSAKRVVWRSLCDPESEVYRMWFESGVMVVLDRKLVAIAVASALAGLQIGFGWLAVSVTAIVLKTGLEVFCDLFEPKDVMVGRHDRS